MDSWSVRGARGAGQGRGGTDVTSVEGLAAGDCLASEALEEPADALEGSIVVVLGVDGEELDDYIVFGVAGSRVADAVGEGSAALWRSDHRSRTCGEIHTSIAILMPGMLWRLGVIKAWGLGAMWTVRTSSQRALKVKAEDT